MFRRRSVKFNIQISVLYLENIELLDRNSTYSISWKRGRNKKNSGNTNYISHSTDRDILEFNEYILLVSTLFVTKKGYKKKNISFKLKNRKKKTIGKAVLNLANLLRTSSSSLADRSTRIISEEKEEEEELEGEDDEEDEKNVDSSPESKSPSILQTPSNNMKRDISIPIIFKKDKRKYCHLHLSVNFSTLLSTSSDASSTSFDDIATEFSEEEFEEDDNNYFVSLENEELKSKIRELELKIKERESTSLSSFPHQNFENEIDKNDPKSLILHLEKAKRENIELSKKIVSLRKKNISSSPSPFDKQYNIQETLQNMRQHSSEIDKNIQTARYKLRKDKHDLKIIRNMVHKKIDDLDRFDKLLQKTFRENRDLKTQIHSTFENLNITIPSSSTTEEEELKKKKKKKKKSKKEKSCDNVRQRILEKEKEKLEKKKKREEEEEEEKLLLLLNSKTDLTLENSLFVFVNEWETLKSILQKSKISIDLKIPKHIKQKYLNEIQKQRNQQQQEEEEEEEDDDDDEDFDSSFDARKFDLFDLVVLIHRVREEAWSALKNERGSDNNIIKKRRAEKLEIEFELLFREYVNHIQIYSQEYPDILRLLIKCIKFNDLKIRRNYRKPMIVNPNRKQRKKSEEEEMEGEDDDDDDDSITFSDDDEKEEEEEIETATMMINLKELFFNQLRRTVVEIFSIYSEGKLMTKELQLDLTKQLKELENVVFRSIDNFERIIFPSLRDGLPSQNKLFGWEAREFHIRNIFFSMNNFLKYRTFQMTILEVQKIEDITHPSSTKEEKKKIEWDMLILYKWMKESYPRIFRKYYDQFNFFKFDRNKDIHRSSSPSASVSSPSFGKDNEELIIVTDVQKTIMKNLKETYISNCSKKLIQWSRHIVRATIFSTNSNSSSSNKGRVLRTAEGISYTKGPKELFDIYKQVTDEVIRLQLFSGIKKAKINDDNNSNNNEEDDDDDDESRKESEILETLLLKFQGVVLEYAQKMLSEVKRRLDTSYSEFKHKFLLMMGHDSSHKKSGRGRKSIMKMFLKKKQKVVERKQEEEEEEDDDDDDDVSLEEEKDVGRGGIVFFSVEKYIPIVNDYLNIARYLVEQKKVMVEQSKVVLLDPRYIEWMDGQTPKLLERMSSDCFREIRNKMMECMKLITSTWFGTTTKTTTTSSSFSEKHHGIACQTGIQQMIRFCEELDALERSSVAEQFQDKLEEFVVFTYLERLFQSSRTNSTVSKKLFNQKWVRVLQKEDWKNFKTAQKKYASGSEKVGDYYTAVDYLLQLICLENENEEKFLLLMGKMLRRFPDFQKECALDIVKRSASYGKKNKKKWVSMVNKHFPDEKRVVLIKTFFSDTKFFF